MARRNWKKLALVALIIITVVVVGITFTIGWRPIIGREKRALTDRKFEATQTRLMRGKYLVTPSPDALGVIAILTGPNPGRRRSPAAKEQDTSGPIRICPGWWLRTSRRTRKPGRQLERRHAGAGDSRRHRP
jgi:hypothetical protein